MAGSLNHQRAVADIAGLLGNVERVVVGKRALVERVLAALLSGGHVLLEDRPGVGKTVLARALARSIDARFSRIQCTPDLLPVDVTGYHDPRSSKFRPGPIFGNIVLADELNRATPRTQSALLEAMAEGQVTVEGTTFPLAPPFMLIATQNPLEYRGVNDLPEAQLDRFQMVLTPGYPSEVEERRLLAEREVSDPLEALAPLLDAARVVQLSEAARAVHLSEPLRDHIVTLVRATRESPELMVGASPRAAIALMHLARAFALVQGREYVAPDDIRGLAGVALAHRVMPRALPDDAASQAQHRSDIISRIVEATPLPREVTGEPAGPRA